MRHGASEPVEFPTKDGIKAPAVRVGHEPIELRPLLLRAGDPNIYILAGNAPAAALAVLLKLKRLDAGILALIGCRDPGIECHSHHLLPFCRSSRTGKTLPTLVELTPLQRHFAQSFHSRSRTIHFAMRLQAWLSSRGSSVSQQVKIGRSLMVSL